MFISALYSLKFLSQSIGIARVRQTYHVPCGFDLLDAHVLEIAGKSFIQPDIIPPMAGHYVTDPLKPRKHIKMTSKFYSMFCTIIDNGEQKYVSHI